MRAFTVRVVARPLCADGRETLAIIDRDKRVIMVSTAHGFDAAAQAVAEAQADVLTWELNEFIHPRHRPSPATGPSAKRQTVPVR